MSNNNEKNNKVTLSKDNKEEYLNIKKLVFLQKVKEYLQLMPNFKF